MKFLFLQKNIHQQQKGFTRTDFSVSQLLKNGNCFFANDLMNNRGKHGKNLRGFTLLEVLIAITILVFAITATFTAAQSGLQSAIESKDQVVAYYMAQEAVEFIRNVRDTNSLAGVTWLTGIADQLSDPCYPGKLCSVDVVANKLTSCPTGIGSCTNLIEDGDQASLTYGMYADTYNGHPASWVPVNFKRVIKIVIVNSNEIHVTVDVTWNRGSFSRVFTAHESIFNWQS